MIAFGVTGVKVKVTVTINRIFLFVLYLTSRMNPGLQTWCTDSLYQGEDLDCFLGHMGEGQVNCY